MAFALTADREKQVEELLTRYPEARAALLPTLWLCQNQNGWISPDVVAFVAARLELSTAVVKGVVSFYTMYFDHEVGDNVIWVCRTLSCDLRGAKAIQEHLEERLGCKAGHSSKNNKFTLLKAECLAACGQAPMVQINDRYYENLDLKLLDAILDTIESQGAEAAAEKFATSAAFKLPVPVARLVSEPPAPSLQAIQAASTPPTAKEEDS